MRRSAIRQGESMERGGQSSTGEFVAVGASAEWERASRSASRSETDTPHEDWSETTLSICREMYDREARRRRFVAALVGGVLIAACGAVGWSFARPGPEPSNPGGTGQSPSASSMAAAERDEEASAGGRRTYGDDAHREFAALAERAESAGKGQGPAPTQSRDFAEGTTVPAETPPGAGTKPSEQSPSERLESLVGDETGAAGGSSEEVSRAFEGARRRTSHGAEGEVESGPVAGRSQEETSAPTRQVRQDDSEGASAGDGAPESGATERGVGRAREASVRRGGLGEREEKGLSDGEIRAGMRRVSESIAACRRRQHRRGAPLEVGKIQISLEVQPDGRVSSYRLKPTSVSATVLGNCLRSRSSGWSFPAFRGGPVTIENRSFVLQ